MDKEDKLYRLLAEIEQFSQQIEHSRSFIEQKIQAIETDGRELEIVEGELVALQQQKHDLEMSRQLDKQLIEKANGRLEKLIAAIKVLNRELDQYLEELADEVMGQAEGVYLLENRLSLVRLRVENKFVTRLVPIRAKEPIDKPRIVAWSSPFEASPQVVWSR